MTTIAVEQALSLPPDQVGDALLRLPEDQWFDRKSSRIAPQDLAKSLISFGNAEGGVLVVGAHGGRIEGTKHTTARLNAQMQANIDFCVPPVRAEQRLVPCHNSAGDEDNLLIMEVHPSDFVHANQKDEVFLRVGDENRKLSFVQRQQLLFDKGEASYESRQITSVDDLDETLLRQYADAVHAPDPMRLLQARTLAVGDQLTIAGCLLFALNPQAYLPETFVRILRYRGRERGTGARQQLLEDIKLEGPIPHQLLAARKKVQRLQPMRRALRETGRFGDVALIPEDAWLEGIVNAAVHRSYSMAGDHIRIEVFDDRIEIHSPGRFPGLVDLSDPVGATRFARNPRIARVAADLNFGQELGEGIRRMFEEMRHAGLTDPAYRQTAGSVELTLSAVPTDMNLEAKLPEHARAVTSILREAERLSTGEIAEALGLSRPSLRRELKALRDAGVIEWVGKSPQDPRAYWRLRPT